MNFQAINMSDIEAKHTGNWFDPDTKRFWGTRLPQTGIELEDGTRMFVSSEWNFHKTERFFTIRRQHLDGSIETVGEFQGYWTRPQATRMMKRIAKELHSKE